MSEEATRGALGIAQDALHRLEDGVLAVLLGTMVILAPLQIFLRNFFDTGFSWADPLLRVLVLWVGLLGAVAASRGDRQISIDVASHFVSEKHQLPLKFVTSLFTSIVCVVVAYYSWQFVATEIEYETVVFAGVSSWMTESIIPFAFGAIALRYGIRSVQSAAVMLGVREPGQ